MEWKVWKRQFFKRNFPILYWLTFHHFRSLFWMLSYKLAKDIDGQLKQMVQDLKTIIDHLNTSNTQQQDTDDPVIVNNIQARSQGPCHSWGARRETLGTRFGWGVKLSVVLLRLWGRHCHCCRHCQQSCIAKGLQCFCGLNTWFSRMKQSLFSAGWEMYWE